MSSAVAERLSELRKLMADAAYDAFIVPREDEYLGEYIPAHNERLLWISGFTGSAGAVVVLRDRAAIFVDGRYTVQVRGQVPGELFEYRHLIEQPPLEWLAAELPAGSRVACDPRLHSLAWYEKARRTLERADIELVPDVDNLIDRCWGDRPAAEISPAVLLDDRYTGESSLDKRRRVGAGLAERGADCALIFAPDSVSWLLNIRGTDIPCLPVVQAMALLESSGDLTLLVEPGRVPAGFEEHVGPGVTVREESAAAEVLAGCEGRRVLADIDCSNAWSQLTLLDGGATLVRGQDPVALPKAAKNAVEVAGSRAAHLRDAVAEIRFLAWLDAEVDAGRLHDEDELALHLAGLRAQGEEFRGLSFDTISAAGPNAAMCHYNHKNAVPARLEMDSVYLVDSGGQYTDGTTDITRTVPIGDPGPEVRRMFTLVLKGHIALDQIRFPHGTTGSQLDVLARQFLWQHGLDYDHGTGHGVGVFLSVHEGPQRISKVANPVGLLPGMILSNEPGYYRDGGYGIRCENLVVVREREEAGDQVPMLGFEVLTLVPFDVRLLDLSLLSAKELAWLNSYHQLVRERVGPLLESADRAWLERATRELGD